MARLLPVVSPRILVGLRRSIAVLALLLMPIEHNEGEALSHLHAGFQIWSDAFGAVKSQHVDIVASISISVRVDVTTNISRLTEVAGPGGADKPSAAILKLLNLDLMAGLVGTVYSVRQWTSWFPVIDPPPRLHFALR